MLDRMYKEYPRGEAPPELEGLAQKIRAADAFVFVVGEYNWGVQPGLKNLTDHFLEEWAWRPAAIASYSAGRFSGVRSGAAWHGILSEMGMVVISSTLAVGGIGEAFDTAGNPTGAGGAALTRAFPRFADDLAWWTEAVRDPARPNQTALLSLGPDSASAEVSSDPRPRFTYLMGRMAPGTVIGVSPESGRLRRSAAAIPQAKVCGRREPRRRPFAALTLARCKGPPSLEAGVKAEESMSKTIVIVGFGPGISTAVAEKFGAEGFNVALVARSEKRLADGVHALKSKGVMAAAFPADATDPMAIRLAIRQARAEFGLVTVVHWNAYGGAAAGDLLTATPQLSATSSMSPLSGCSPRFRKRSPIWRARRKAPFWSPTAHSARSIRRSTRWLRA